EVREWIAERRKLPIENREYFLAGSSHDEIVDPIVAVHDRDAGLRRQGRWQPNDQSLGHLDSVGLGCPILLDPARDLTLEEIAGTTERRKAGGLRVDPMKRRERIDHAVINDRASTLGQMGKRAVGEIRALDQGHQKESRADHRLVFAKRDRKSTRLNSSH